MARNTKPQMDKILSMRDPSEIHARGVGGVLSKLFQTILIQLQVRNTTWSSLLYDYMNDPRNRMPKDRNTQTSRRGNLMKELSDEKMTWKVFCKAMKVLQFKRIEITVRAYHRHGGRISDHTVGVDLEQPQDEVLYAEKSTTGNVSDVKQEVIPSKTLKGLDQ